MDFLKAYLKRYFILYLLVGVLFVGGARLLDRSVEVMNQAVPGRSTIVIDPGHGGEDGGATSCTGALESQINLEISLKLHDLLHLLGYRTSLIRSTDTAVYTEGESIAQKKVSDLKHRVEMVNAIPNAVLVSIHQNHFPEAQYHGAQVFYAPTEGSRAMAENLQALLIETVNPGSKRACKPADGVYLMQKINCPGILVECGFLSNPEEETLLRSADYQLKICCVIAKSLRSK